MTALRESKSNYNDELERGLPSKNDLKRSLLALELLYEYPFNTPSNNNFPLLYRFSKEKGTRTAT